MSINSLERMLVPRSIAVIGASEKAGYGGRMMKNLITHSYKGKLYPINPNYERIFGWRAYPSLDQVESDIDLAIIIVKAEKVPQILKQCEQKRVGSVLIISAGFREMGSNEGVSREHQIREWAKRTGIPVCGPNCLGIYSQPMSMWATSASTIGENPVSDASIGLISHSGATAFGPLLQRGNDFGVSFRYMISTGNEADRSMIDFADAMLEDSEISSVALFIEGIKDGERFIQLSEKALKLGKPLIVMKVGESEVGKRAAESHTASMTGDQEVFKALCTQKGIMLANDYDELLYLAMCFERKKRPSGKRFAVISHSGGIGGFIGDKMGAAGITIPPLQLETRKKVKPLIKGFGSSQNPLDLSGTMQTDRLVSIFQILEDDESFDGYVFATHGTVPFVERLKRIDQSTDKPVYVMWTGSQSSPLLKEVRACSIPTFLSGDKMAITLARILRYMKKAKNASRVKKESSSFRHQNIASLLHSFGNHSTLNEFEGKSFLRSIGIATPRSHFFASREEIIFASGTVDFSHCSYAAKIVSRSITHKSDLGCVALNVSSLEEVLHFYDEKVQQFPAGHIEGLLLEEMVHDKIELILGSSFDEQFGPVIMVGLGGVFTELFRMVTWRIAPVNASEAEEMIYEIKGLRPYLEGARGNKRRDIEKLIDTIVRFSSVVYDGRNIISNVEINPLAVLPDDKGVVALDCVIHLHDKK